MGYAMFFHYVLVRHHCGWSVSKGNTSVRHVGNNMSDRGHTHFAPTRSSVCGTELFR